MRVFGVTEKDHAASAVRLVAGPRCSSRQPSLCRWSRFLQHSQPLVLLLGLFASLEFHSKLFLSPQSRSFLASLCPTRKVLARASVWHARTKRTEDFSIHVPLCLDSLSLALPGSLPLLCLRWCLNWNSSLQLTSPLWVEKAACHHVLSWQSETLGLVRSAKNVSVKVSGS